MVEVPTDGSDGPGLPPDREEQPDAVVGSRGHPKGFPVPLLYDYVADLHIHSVLSPCGDLAMSPGAILSRARQVGLSLVALTDHNHAGNCVALRDVAMEAGLRVLYGLEVRTEEEVDVLCLFDKLEAVLAWQEVIYPALPDVANDPLLFGDQVVVDRTETILQWETKLLINAVMIPVQTIAEEVIRRGGLVIPAHIDRPVNSLLSQLGFPPSGCPFDAAEISPFGSEEEVRARHPSLRRMPLVRFSDAHRLDEIGKQRTVFRVKEPTVTELRKALRGEEGRSFCALPPSVA